MSRRSHATLRATEKSRQASRDSCLTEQEQKSKVLEAVDAASRRLVGVFDRLDRANELDRRNSERRMANMPPPLDLGEP